MIMEMSMHISWLVYSDNCNIKLMSKKPTVFKSGLIQGVCMLWKKNKLQSNASIDYK